MSGSGGRSCQDLHAVADRIAGLHVPVLVVGETGVGKQYLAERIHRYAHRRGGAAFVRIDCAGATEDSFENELQGAATAFLDGIDQLSRPLQGTLLRLLDVPSIRALGAGGPRAVGPRFIAACDRELERAVQSGAFRPDLLHRLAVVRLVIPPLRERPREILALAESFLRRACRARGLPAMAFSRPAVSALLAHDWPGNIRELGNAVSRAVILANGPAIHAVHLQLGSAWDAACAMRATG